MKVSHMPYAQYVHFDGQRGLARRVKAVCAALRVSEVGVKFWRDVMQTCDEYTVYIYYCSTYYALCVMRAMFIS